MRREEREVREHEARCGSFAIAETDDGYRVHDATSGQSAVVTTDRSSASISGMTIGRPRRSAEGEEREGDSGISVHAQSQQCPRICCAGEGHKIALDNGLVRGNLALLLHDKGDRELTVFIPQRISRSVPGLH